MTVTDHLRDDDEYIRLFLGLIERESEATRLDGEELREHDFAPVQVVGQDTMIWLRGGVFYTTERALAEVRPTITDDKED